MALVVNDRVKETSTTTGTGTFTLAGAVLGFETFSSAIGNTNTTYYSIVNENGEFEVGLGTVGAGTLARTTILSSSNSDSAVNFSAGTKDVFCTLPASKAVILDSSGNIVANNGSNLTNLNADNLASGTVPDARFPATLPAVSGANLTNLDASDLASGTVPDARFPATLPAISGANLTNLDASDLASGTVPDARFPATLPAISGANLTSLNATNIASGTLSSDRLPTVPTTKGGTGLTAIGTANQVLAVNGAGTALEYQTPTTGDITGVTAGNGLTGGGTSGDVTLNVGAGALIDVTADAIDVDLSELTTSTSDADGDFFVVIDSANAQKKLTKANINISGFNNDSGFIDGSSLNASNLSSGTVPDARFPETLPAISGSNLTFLNASNLASGTLPDARFPATLPATSGSNLTFLNASNLASGTLPDARFPATLPATSGSNLTFLNASNLASGTLPDARFPSPLPAISGSNLTFLNASNLASGTVPIARIDLNLLTTSTADGDGDFFVVVDSVGAEKKLTKANINISGFNNNSGFTTNTGTVTSVGVTAGSGLTGGGTVTTSGTVTLNVGAGTGIDVAADAISVDVSDFMTNGVNNRVLTATGTDAMNAEANMTFDATDLSIPQNIVHLGDTNCYIGFHATDQWRVVTGGTERFEVNDTAITAARNFVPGANDTYDLGALGNVWRNLYTGDLHLSNEAKSEGNAVDGTKGNWTIQEGENDLYILNNKSGKKYKFKLEEI
jgi:hypothetical protein